MQTVPRSVNFGKPENYVFDARTTPVLKVKPGEAFAAEIEDTYNGILRSDRSKLQPRDLGAYTDRMPYWYNPVCGPVYVEAGRQRQQVRNLRIPRWRGPGRGLLFLWRLLLRSGWFGRSLLAGRRWRRGRAGVDVPFVNVEHFGQPAQVARVNLLFPFFVLAERGDGNAGP